MVVFGNSVRESSSFDTILFDLDDTLYPGNTGLSGALKRNIEDFLVEKCGFSETQAATLRVELFKTYGSTLAGLRVLGYNVDADDYHSVVHGRLPYDLIKADPQLRNLLNSISQRKIIFTNSDRIHAMKAMDRLGIADCFDQIICFETMNPNLSKATRPDEFPVVLKPSMEALKIALSVAEVDPRRTVGKTMKTKEADYALEKVNNLAQVIPEIWVNGVEKGEPRISRTNSEIESSLAITAVGA
jgi:putative hydrolase of the HAD superfamily